MGIRKAALRDLSSIGSLLRQLEYPGTEDFLAEKLQQLIDDPEEELLVYEDLGSEGFGKGSDGIGRDHDKEPKILAFISLHFIPQLALKGDFARISYFSVDADARGQGIGKLLEEHCVMLAKKRGCDRMEVHCHTRRVAAHAFYFRQGFVESPKYLMKSLR